MLLPILHGRHPVIPAFPHLTQSFPLPKSLALCQYVVMVCIYCGHDTQVINSRPQKRMNSIWRRRRCKGCQAVFTTTEAPDLLLSWRLQKHSNLEPFSRDNLFVSVYDSLRHRKTALEDASGLTDTIISKCLPHIQNAMLTRDILVKHATATLKHFDSVAATHYAAFHPL